jgi:hypothetical protein
VEKINLRRQNELEVRKQYRIKISNRFVALDRLGEKEDIIRTWENIKVYIKTSAKEILGLYELKQYKPWFDEECLVFLYQKNQTKMQWLQDPNQSNTDKESLLRAPSLNMYP